MLPNFLIIGEAKAGTTSLHNYLNQHPDDFISEYKEPDYFTFLGAKGPLPKYKDRPVITKQEEYENLFSKAVGKTVIGESSPTYLEFASE